MLHDHSSWHTSSEMVQLRLSYMESSLHVSHHFVCSRCIGLARYKQNKLRKQAQTELKMAIDSDSLCQRNWPSQHLDKQDKTSLLLQ